VPVKTYKREIRKNPKVHGTFARWSEAQKLEAVTTYLLSGSWVVTAQATGVPVDTLKKWGAARWWKEMEEQVRRSSKLQVSGKLQRVMDKAFVALEDRVENGDFIFNQKTGNLTRVPVSARNLSAVVNTTIDKQALLDKLQKEPVQDSEAISSRLAKIQEEFRRFAKAKIIEVEPIYDVQTRLPTGEQVQIDTRADPQAGGAEQSTEGSSP
jgi:transposase-like protein